MNDFIVDLNDVKIYQDDHLVLNNVNLKVKSGELVYLVWKTGSGKTSLIKTLYADIPLKYGIGRVSGFNLKNIKQSKIPYLRRDLAEDYQDFQLLNDRSVKENLLFVLKATGWNNNIKIQNRIKKVLELVGMSYKDYKKTYELSGGEKQRVSIARSLLNEPKLIIADEPTGNLDPKTSKEIMLLFKKVQSDGIAILMATHNYQIIHDFPSKIYNCSDGSVQITERLILWVFLQEFCY